MKTQQSPIFEVFIGVLIIIGLSWFANISHDTGHLAVGIILLFWFLWIMNNSSKVQAFAQKATGV